MALKETVEILFLATDKTGTTITGIGRGLEDLSAPIAGATKKFLLLEGAIIALGAAFAGKAFAESVKFESALLDLQKVLGEGEGDASDYTEEVDRLALKFGESANEILAGAADIKQAGFTVAEAMKLQEDALTAAVISELSVEEATTLMIRSLKGFKAEASDATRILDLFNEVSNKNATNVRELANGFAEFAPVAQKLGLTFEEANALLVPIIETFGSGAEAGNALKIALTSLIVPTGPAADELDRLGISVRDSSGQLRKGRDVTFELIEAMSKLAPTQQIATLSIIAGERQAARLSETFGNQAKVLKILKEQTTATGSAQKEFNIRIAATEKQIDKAGVAFNIMARTIGDRFKPELAGAIIGIREIQQAFTELVKGGGLDPFINAITPQLNALAEVLAGIAKALPEAWKDVDFSPIVDSLESIFEGASSLFDGLDLSKPEDLAQAINGLIEIGGSFISTTEGIVGVLGKVGGIIIDVIKFYGDLDTGTQKLIGSVGGASLAVAAFAPVITSVGAAIGALAGAGGPLIALLGILSGPVGIVVALGATAAAFVKFSADASGAAYAAELEMDSLNHAVQRNSDEISTRLERLGYASFEAFQDAVDAGEVFFDDTTAKWIKKLDDVSGAVNDMGDAFEANGDRIVNTAEEQAKLLEKNAALAGAMGDAWELVGDEIVNVGKQTADSMSEAEKHAGELFATLEDGTRIYSGVKEAVKGLAKETKKKIDADKEATKALTQRVDALAKFKLGLEEIQSKERISIFEIKAEVDIAQVEAGMQAFSDMTELVSTGITSTGDSITDLFKILSEDSGRYGFEIRNAIERESDIRERQFALEEELIRAQIDILDARKEAMERGEAQISVTAEGLEPHLQEILRSIIDAMRIEATSEEQQFLLGIGGG